MPGDKSISHRAAILAGMARGTCRLTNYLTSEDCVQTLKAMEALGAPYRLGEDGGEPVAEVEGTGGALVAPSRPLDAGNSGTSMRLLAGLAAGSAFPVTLCGDESLTTRPMGRIKAPLESMGATIQLSEKGTAPMQVRGGGLKAIDYSLPVASAQVKSCILLAALFAEGTTTLIEPAPTRDHTERLFQMLGIPVSVAGLQVQLVGYGPAGPAVGAFDLRIPGDFSSAAFHLLAASAHRGSEVRIQGVGLNPRRTAFLRVLHRMGASVEVLPAGDGGAEQHEPQGDLLVTGAPLHGVEVGGEDIPNLIDELPLVAVAGALAEGETVIRDAAELRVKESDRIATMVGNLRACGVDVDEWEDGMAIRGPATIHVPERGVNSFGDHRVAMAMAILALFADRPLSIHNTACVNTSYPTFWEHLNQVGVHVEI